LALCSDIRCGPSFHAKGAYTRRGIGGWIECRSDERAYWQRTFQPPGSSRRTDVLIQRHRQTTAWVQAILRLGGWANTATLADYLRWPSCMALCIAYPSRHAMTKMAPISSTTGSPLPRAFGHHARPMVRLDRLSFWTREVSLLRTARLLTRLLRPSTCYGGNGPTPVPIRFCHPSECRRTMFSAPFCALGNHKAVNQAS
jgi:hypothetical protein